MSFYPSGCLLFTFKEKNFCMKQENTCPLRHCHHIVLHFFGQIKIYVFLCVLKEYRERGSMSIFRNKNDICEVDFLIPTLFNSYFQNLQFNKYVVLCEIFILWVTFMF